MNEIAVEQEKGVEAGASASNNGHDTPPKRDVKTTSRGVVLDPQPSDDPADPLNWAANRKRLALATLTFMSFMCFFSIISIVPATVELAMQYHVAEPTAVYLGSTPTLIYAVAPFLYAPVSHVIGRRSVMLVSSFLAIIFSIGVALSHTYASTLVLRLFQGFAACASLSLGPAAISDMFFTHERGRSLGIYVLFLVTSPFIGGVIGGAIDSRLGWQWSQWVSAIGYGLCWVLHYLFVPETIYVRGSPSTTHGVLAKAFKIQIPPSSARHGFFYNFSRPLIMFSYPACIMPCLWFSLSYSLQVVITANFPVVFMKPPFDFNTLQVGYCSFSGLIGAVVGECFAGPVIDFISRRQLSGGKEFQPEMRLQALWPGLIAVPVGYIVFGTKIQFVTGWAPPLVGVGVFLFGQEILTTVIQTYLVECFPQQAAEVSLVFNFWRNVQAFWPPFFMTAWIARVGGGLPFGVFAIVTVVTFPILMGPLMWRGKRIREWSGTPTFSRAT